MADLGTAGMDGPDAYIQGGRDLFREENLDIFRAIEDPVKTPTANPENDLPPDKIEYFRGRMLAWSAFQVKFAEDRKARLENELGNLPETAKNAVRKLFCRFDQTIEASKQKNAEELQMSFNDLLRSFGYSF